MDKGPGMLPCKFGCQCPLLYSLTLGAYTEDKAIEAIYHYALSSLDRCSVAKDLLHMKLPELSFVKWRFHVFDDPAFPDPTGVVDYFRWRVTIKREWLLSALKKRYHAAHALDPSNVPQDIRACIDPQIAWDAGNIYRIFNVIQLPDFAKMYSPEVILKTMYIAGTRAHSFHYGPHALRMEMCKKLDAVCYSSAWIFAAMSGSGINLNSSKYLLETLGSPVIAVRNRAHQAAYLVGAVVKAKGTENTRRIPVSEMVEMTTDISREVFLGQCSIIFETSILETRRAVDAWTIVAKRMLAAGQHAFCRDVIRLIANHVWNTRYTWTAANTRAAKVHRNSWGDGARKKKTKERKIAWEAAKKRKEETRDCIERHKRLKQEMPKRSKITPEYIKLLWNVAEASHECAHCIHTAGECTESTCGYCKKK